MSQKPQEIARSGKEPESEVAVPALPPAIVIAQAEAAIYGHFENDDPPSGKPQHSHSYQNFREIDSDGELSHHISYVVLYKSSIRFDSYADLLSFLGTNRIS